MDFLKTGLPKGLGGIPAKQQGVLLSGSTGRHPDSGQKCRIFQLKTGYVYIFSCVWWVYPGIWRNRRSFYFFPFFFSGTVDKDINLKVMANSS